MFDTNIITHFQTELNTNCSAGDRPGVPQAIVQATAEKSSLAIYQASL